MRNVFSATGVIGLRVEGNTITGARDVPPGQPAAGIDIEPDDRGQPALDLRIAGSTIADNAGPGILLELESNRGHAVLASRIEITGNTIVRNALKPTPPKRAGIVLAGGQDGGEGRLVLTRNVIRENGGPGVLGSRLNLVVEEAGNDLTGNSGGPSQGVKFVTDLVPPETAIERGPRQGGRTTSRNAVFAFAPWTTSPPPRSSRSPAAWTALVSAAAPRPCD